MSKMNEASIPMRLEFRWRQDGDEGEYIIYQHPVTGMLDILNPVATEIFLKCDGKASIGEIADQILKEYVGVDRETILSDIKGFIEHMIKERVFFVVNA